MKTDDQQSWKTRLPHRTTELVASEHMVVENFAGGRWWKFDFHTHTPKSFDFKDKNVKPEDWLLAFMNKDIDCLAVTDHNSGAWIDDLQQTLKQLEGHPKFRPLYLFTGVEISVQNGGHVLALFGADKKTSDIDSLLGAVKYQGTKGDSDGVTEKSLTEVIDEIAEAGGIAIPAHVDKDKGLFKMVKGSSLEPVLENKNIVAIELRDHNYHKPQLYHEKKPRWSEVNGSDTHSLNDIGTFTWIKMGERPSLEGLRLALLDGTGSVNRDTESDPNQLPDFFIDELTIDNAQYIGQSKPFSCRFSPFLNSIIGGRGTGKSTLIEFMRLILRRDKDEGIESLLKDLAKYYQSGDGLLTDESNLSLIYLKQGITYRLNWTTSGAKVSLEVKDDNGEWVTQAGEIKSFFPADIYSQKQIFVLANEPRYLLAIIDRSLEVDKINDRIKELELRYQQLAYEIRHLHEKIDKENRLQGELNDLEQQIKKIEQAGHKELFAQHHHRQNQQREVTHAERQWQKIDEQLKEALDNIVPPIFNRGLFSNQPNLLKLLDETNSQWLAISDELVELHKRAEQLTASWQKNKLVAIQELTASIAHYQLQLAKLKEQGLDLSGYPLLLQKRLLLQQEVKKIADYRNRMAELTQEQGEILKNLAKEHGKISQQRQSFLDKTLQGNDSVAIEIEPFKESWHTVEPEIRKIINCHAHFDDDFDKLKDTYHQDGYEKLKERIIAITQGVTQPKHKNFTERLTNLSPDVLTKLELWFADDRVKITFGGDKKQDLSQGSPGQKTAALLSFILAGGEGPLLLDQPEDDLDNELIYSLVVRQLRQCKNKRQVIVVTHNANIVVNADAEQVLPLKIEQGETQTSAGSLADNKASICNILEGGSEAFRQRYRRIGGEHV